MNVLSGEKVLSINENEIETQEDVEFILDGLNINERVTVQIARSGSVRRLTIQAYQHVVDN